MTDYKVALEITAAGNVEQVLERISSKLLGINAETERFSKQMANWGKLVGGAAMVAGGVEVLKFVDHIAKAGGDLTRQANIFRSAGNSVADTSKAILGAYDAVQKVPGVDAVDAMKRYREIAGATQDNVGSIAVLPDFLKAQVVYGATTGADPEEGMQRIAKMIELRQGAIDHLTHKIDPVKFSKELDVAVKALQVGQGLITANDLQMLVKQAGPMAKGMDPTKFWSIYLASLEDMGGARTGTAMTAVARQVLGGIMTPKVADEWERIGMLNPIGQGWQMKKGHVDINDPSKAIRGYDTFRDDGFQDFIEKFVRPAFEKDGLKTDQQQNSELYRFGSTETARRLYSMYMTGSEQVEAVQKKLRHAMGLDAYDNVFKGGDYKQGIDSLTASIKSLEEAAGGPAGKAIGKMASELSEQINKLAKFAINHPAVVELGTYATVAAAGLSVLAGSVLAVSAALRLGGWIGGAGAAASAAAGPAAGTVAAAAGSAAVGEGAVAGAEAGAAARGLFGGGGKLLGGLFSLPTLAAGGAAWELGNSDSALRKYLEPKIAAFNKSGYSPLHLGDYDSDRTYMMGLQYARQSDIHPIIRGERDMEANRARVMGSPGFAAAPSGLPYSTRVDKNYGDRRNVFGGNMEAERESRRGAALSNMAAPSVSATLQATVNTTVPFTVNVDGQAVANAIMPKITQLIQQAMSAAAGQLMGHTNEVSAYHGAGIGHN